MIYGQMYFDDWTKIVRVRMTVTVTENNPADGLKFCSVSRNTSSSKMTERNL